MVDAVEEPTDDTVEEIAIYRDCAINLPLLLYSERSVLSSVLNYTTWALLLDDEERDHLRQYLPHFPRPQDSYHLQEETVQLLLSGKNFKFGNPVHLFHKKLQLGHFNPRIAELLSIEQQASYTKYKLMRQKYYKDLLTEILMSRKAALHDAMHTQISFVGSSLTNDCASFTEREKRLQAAAQLEYEKIWLSVKISTQDYSNSSDEDDSFEDRLNRHKELAIPEVSLQDMLCSYRKRRNSHILYPDLITEKVTLRSVRQRVEKKKRRMNEIYRKKAMEALAIESNNNNNNNDSNNNNNNHNSNNNNVNNNDTPNNNNNIHSNNNVGNVHHHNNINNHYDNTQNNPGSSRQLGSHSHLPGHSSVNKLFNPNFPV